MPDECIKLVNFASFKNGYTQVSLLPISFWQSIIWKGKQTLILVSVMTKFNPMYCLKLEDTWPNKPLSLTIWFLAAHIRELISRKIRGKKPKHISYVITFSLCVTIARVSLFPYNCKLNNLIMSIIWLMIRI